MPPESSWPVRDEDNEDDGAPVYRAIISWPDGRLLVLENGRFFVSQDNHPPPDDASDVAWQKSPNLVVQAALGRLDPVQELRSSWRTHLVLLAVSDVPELDEVFTNEALRPGGSSGGASSTVNIYARYV